MSSVRNPDLLTALTVLTRGTYTRLPTAITEAFIPRAPLTNADILDTLRRLDAHILFRLRCIDFVPPDIRIDKIKDGRAYIVGGKGEWRIELSLTGFGTGDQSRWWLTGLEWDWRNRVKGAEGTNTAGAGRRFKGNERQEILDTINREVLPAPDVSSISLQPPDTDSKGGKEDSPSNADAPLVRLVNFIRKSGEIYAICRKLTGSRRAFVSVVPTRNPFHASYAAQSGEMAQSARRRDRPSEEVIDA